MTETPVAYVVFNRPSHTERSFAVVREQRPSRLFIIADGPRLEYPNDVERCAAVRAIVEQIDWPCDVRRNYADSNLGLKNRVSSGLDWVFEQVERAVVLEDDCVAHPDFFRFCDSLLNKYADDERVAVITGNNFQNGQKRGDGSYYFSKYNHCWGWATWRRAWKLYDGALAFWPEWKQSQTWQDAVKDPVEREYWERVFDACYEGKIDSWAYPWTASVWFNGGVTATPNENLVENIGVGSEASHTKSRRKHMTVKTRSLGLITNPEKLVVDSIADRYTFDFHFGGRKRRWPWNVLLPARTIASRLISLMRRLHASELLE